MCSITTRHVCLALLAAAPLAAGTPITQAQTVRRVDCDKTNCSGSENGSNWTTQAYCDLQDAIDDSASGDSIWAKTSTCYPSTGDRTASFVMKNNVSIYGGFEGWEDELSDRNLGADDHTILSGDYDQDGTGESYNVVKAISLSSTTRLDGLKITKGNADQASGGSNGYEIYGGGLHITGCADLQLVNCIVSDNYASQNGGGIFAKNSDLTLDDTDVTSNRAGPQENVSNVTYKGGAGIYFEGTPQTPAIIRELTVTGGTFSGNVARWPHASADVNKGAGGAVRLYDYVSATFEDVDFENNFGMLSGGAISGLRLANPGTAPPSTLAILGCRFTGNGLYGGGTSVLYGPFTVQNIIVTVDQISGNPPTRTRFEGNKGLLVSGALYIGYPNATLDPSSISHVDFIDNASQQGGGLWLETVEATVHDCTFTGNQAPNTVNNVFFGRGGGAWVATDSIVDFTDCTFGGPDSGDENTAEEGGAIWVGNSTVTVEDCTFDNNVSEDGGGGIWAEGSVANNANAPRTAVLNLDGCTFRGNTMTDQNAVTGGGGVFLEGQHTTDPSYPYDGIATGTWTNCTFIGNDAVRGGGAYIHSTARVDVKGCKFLANTTSKAGGGMGIGDPDGIGTTDVRISKSDFVSNTSAKGGAIHNHERAKTYMVNCVLAGNSSTEEGGAIFNSRHTGSGDVPPELHMHNCLIVGNVAQGSGDLDMGGAVFGGLDTTGDPNDIAITDLRHCTLIANHAGYKYGGAVNGSPNSRLFFYNSIARYNTDADGGTAGWEEQLMHVDGYTAGDIDNFITMPSDGGEPGIYDGDTITYSTGDPVFSETSTSASWTGTASYDATTGTTTFSISSIAGDATPNERFFQPDTSSPIRLLIKQIIANTSIICWGKVSGAGTLDPARIRNYHIGSAGVADEYGDTDLVPRDWCDLNGTSGDTDPLPYDLDLATREQDEPDAGCYEIQP